MKKSKLDPINIAQMSFDEEMGASRVHVVDADIAIELSADDGDSVIVRQDSSIVVAKDGDILDLSKVSKVCLLGLNENIQLIQMHNKEEIGGVNIFFGEVKEICLTQVKIANAKEVVFLVVK